MRAYLWELRDALALARALGRTLILPRRLCYADKLWAGSDNILRTGYMYPGSQDMPFLPFDCPMDHVLSPHDWAAVNYRDQVRQPWPWAVTAAMPRACVPRTLGVLSSMAMIVLSAP